MCLVRFILIVHFFFKRATLSTSSPFTHSPYLEHRMSHDASPEHMTVSSAAPHTGIQNPEFGFDAEVAADVAGEAAAGMVGSSPPIAVPANKAHQTRPNLSVQVAYDPPEFRTVSPPVWEQCSDSPIGGGLMYVMRICVLIICYARARVSDLRFHFELSSAAAVLLF
jgi:hypothetical protein